jgi:hypothetical protein
VVHWLLREPALEAEALSAKIDNGRITVTRQTLSADNPGDATVTAPDGSARTVSLAMQAPGIYMGSLPAAQAGVWTVREGGMTIFATMQPDNAEEYQDLAATADLVKPLGQTVWLGRTPHPNLAAMLRRQHAMQVTGTRNVPLLPPLPAMILAVGLLGAAWWRERG